MSLFDAAGRITASRAYHTIPTSGDGQSGANYDETTFGYDALGRQNMQKTPGGTITRTAFNAQGQPACVYVGTNDEGASDEDPSAGNEPCLFESGGSSASSGEPNPNNDLVLVTEYEYASSAGCTGCSGGAGQLTAVIQHVDETTIGSPFTTRPPGIKARATSTGRRWRSPAWRVRTSCGPRSTRTTSAPGLAHGMPGQIAPRATFGRGGTSPEPRRLQPVRCLRPPVMLASAGPTFLRQPAVAGGSVTQCCSCLQTVDGVPRADRACP